MSGQHDQVVSWYGRFIKDMTRDELEEAFQQLARMHNRDRAEHLRQLGNLGDLRQARVDREAEYQAEMARIEKQRAEKPPEPVMTDRFGSVPFDLFRLLGLR